MRRRFQREHLREADDAGLRRAVGAVLRHAHAACGRRDVDDAATVAGFDHAAQRPAREQVHAVQIDIDDAIPLIVGDLPEVLFAAVRKPRVVDDDVDAAKRGQRLRDDTLRFVGLREVRIDAKSAPPERFDLGDDRRDAPPACAHFFF
ncbi:MAG: hypothetical protein WD359_00165, partial [Dehalococcoidia bacterium]